MRRRAVVALLVVLDAQLPVGGDVVGLVGGYFQIGEIKQGHGFRQVANGAFERRRLVAEADEHQAVDLAVGNRPE